MTEYAVLIPYVNTEAGEALLMEVRSDVVPQPGEICFPGGQIEEGETAEATAVRETCEELGLSPDDIELISLPGYEIMADGRKVWHISARLHIDDLAGLKLSGCEVSEAFLLPVDWLVANPPLHFDLESTDEDDLPPILHKYLENYRRFRRKGSTYYWEYEGHGIWGLTAGLLKKNLDRGRDKRDGETDH